MALPANAWQKTLNKGSFRGVPFFLADTSMESGRRLSVYQYPLREWPTVEDLGRKPERYSVNCYVLINSKTPNYMQARNLLKDALQRPGIGTLVHPYYGEHQVFVENYSLEEKRDEGGICYFQATFLNTSIGIGRAIPTALVGKLDTVKNLIARAQAAIAAVKAYFVKLYDQTGISSFLQDLGINHINLLQGNLVQQLVSGLTTGSGILAPLQQAIGNLGNLASNAISSLTVANSILSIFESHTKAQGQAAQATTIGNRSLAQNALLNPTSDYSRTGRGATPLKDVTLGLKAMATWGDDFPEIASTTPQRAQEATNQRVLRQLVQVAAVASVAQVITQIEYANVEEATAQMNALLAFLDHQSNVAADAGQDQLFIALGNLSSAVTSDMTTRAAQLPRLTPYHMAVNLPSLSLSQRLYQSSSNDQSLVALNGVVHPLFCARDGEYLAA